MTPPPQKRGQDAVGGDLGSGGSRPGPTARGTGGKRRRAAGRGRGALIMITLLLVTSAVIRIGLVTDARALGSQETTASQTPAESSGPGVTTTLLEALQAREARLRDAEADLAERQAAQKLMDDALDQKLAELSAAEQALAETITRAETAAEDDLARLTAVYENMKPAKAAALFEAMAPDFAAGFLARMRPEAAAGIMAGLTPQAAYSISALLAGRNARVPTE